MEERREKDRVDATLFTCTGIPIQGKPGNGIAEDQMRRD